MLTDIYFDMTYVAFLIATVFWVYIHITSEPEMIMNWFYLKMESMSSKWNKLHKLLTCEYCLAGFTSLWLYIFMFDYNFFNHIAFVSLTILFVKLFNVYLNEKD